jgi:hypothetical protein
MTTNWKGHVLTAAEEQAIDQFIEALFGRYAGTLAPSPVQPAPTVSLDEPVVVRQKATKPNKQALWELHERLMWFLATSEQKKNAKRPKRSKPAAATKAQHAP